MSKIELKEAIEYGRLLAAGGKVYSSDKRHFLTQKGMTLLCDAAEKSVHFSPNAREEVERHIDLLEKLGTDLRRFHPFNQPGYAADICKDAATIFRALLSTSS